MPNAADTTADVVDSVWGWAKQPFKSNGSIIDWALFVGIILVFIAMWSLILHDLKGEL